MERYYKVRTTQSTLYVLAYSIDQARIIAQSYCILGEVIVHVELDEEVK